MSSWGFEPIEIDCTPALLRDVLDLYDRMDGRDDNWARGYWILGALRGQPEPPSPVLPCEVCGADSPMNCDGNHNPGVEQ